MIEQGWNWNSVSRTYWGEPAEDIYYFLSRWKGLQLNRFLDIGCGIGRHSLFFAREGFDVTGFDLSLSGLEALREEANASNLHVNAVHGNNNKLPFDDDSFDCILAYHSIYHTDMAGMLSAISEVRRVLEPGGEFYLSLISKSDPDFSNGDFELIDPNSKMKPEEDGSLLPHFFIDYKEIISLFEEFEILRVRHIEDLYEDKSSWHYFIHLKRV